MIAARLLRHSCDEGGFTVSELIVAAGITVVVAGALFAAMKPAQGIFQAQIEAADLQQRMRVGVDTLRNALVIAGAGAADRPLSDVLAPVLPYRAFGAATDPAAGLAFRSDTVSVLHVPTPSSPATLAAPLAPDSLTARLKEASTCPDSTGATLCGISSGDYVLIVDGEATWDVFRVDHVDAAAVYLEHPGPTSGPSFQAGAFVTRVQIGTYRVKVDPETGAYQLIDDAWDTDRPIVDNVVKLSVQYFGDPRPFQFAGARLPDLGGTDVVELTQGMLTDGPWCPKEAAPNRFDADLLRIRRVRVSFRVQAALASLRGPAGPLFLRGGTSSDANRFVPDLEVQFDVTPRNMGLVRRPVR